MHRTGRTRRYVVLVLVFLGGGAATAMGYRWVPELFSGDQVPTILVEEQRFVRAVTAEGNLEAAKATPLAAPAQTRMPLKIAWLALDGSRVQKGDVVVRFDPTDMEEKLADGQAALQTAANKIQKERVESGLAQRGRDRTADLARQELDQVRRFQSKDERIFSRNEIIGSEIDSELSQAKMSHAGATKAIERSVSKSKLALLSIEKRAAEYEINQAKQGLSSLELIAPHAGIVVFKRDWRGDIYRVGDTIWRGQTLAEIPLVATMQAAVFVLEADADGLEPGVPATVILEAHPETEHQAKITRVDTLAKPRLRDLPVQYFRVTLALEHTDTEWMKPGQRVRATLVLDDRSALVVPRQAVFEDQDGNPIVYRQHAGGFEAVKVILGPSTPGRVVVEEGLRQGARIALRDPTKPAAAAQEDPANQQNNMPGQQ